jgi:AcrR family transcriptional regulator
MAGLGFSVPQISKLTGYRPSTLFRFFRHELTTAALERDLDVVESAWRQAVGGPQKDFRLADASMTRFWLGHRLGWKAPTAFMNPHVREIDLDRLSDDELHELDRLLERAGDQGPGEGGPPAPGG